jgi:uncharacterized protein YkwD
MAARDYFSHDIGNVPGSHVFAALLAGGVTYRVAGENLARIYRGPISPGSPTDAGDTAAQAEMVLGASPTHRANILYPARRNPLACCEESTVTRNDLESSHGGQSE